MKSFSLKDKTKQQLIQDHGPTDGTHLYEFGVVLKDLMPFHEIVHIPHKMCDYYAIMNIDREIFSVADNDLFRMTKMDVFIAGMVYGAYGKTLEQFERE